MYSFSETLPPMFNIVPDTGAANIGELIFLPNNSMDVSGFETLCMTLIFIFIFSRLFLFSMKDEPLPLPPIPGTSPAQANPLQILHTLHVPLKFSLADFSKSL